jgi:hypothetical protein
MKLLTLGLIVAVLALGSVACRHNRNDETGRGERQDRLDTTQGRMPTR